MVATPLLREGVWRWDDGDGRGGSRRGEYWRLFPAGMARPRRVTGGHRPQDRLPLAHRERGPPPSSVDGSGAGYLSLFERQRIATLRRQGFVCGISRARLDRSPSTISRELRRNMSPYDAASMTATSRTLGPVSGCSVAGTVGSPATGAPRSVQAKLSWSGARSRSRPGFAPISPTGRPGISVTRRSTRPCTTRSEAV